MNYIIASVGIFILLFAWLLVQYLARDYAERHPEFGPAKEEGGGCGTRCGCQGGRCRRK